MAFNSMSIRSQVLLAPALAVLISLALGGAAIYGFQALSRALESVVGERLTVFKAAAEVESKLREVNSLVLQSLGYESMSYSKDVIAQVDAQFATTSAQL